MPVAGAARRGRFYFWALFAGSVVLLLWTVYAFFALTGPLAWSCGLVYLAYDTVLLVFMVLAARRALRAATPDGGAPASARPRVSVLVPTRDERAILPSCLEALLAGPDGPDEIIVIDDGSTDGTAEWLCRTFSIAPGSANPGVSATRPTLKLWRKPHSGKARSLNEVWPAATGEIVLTIDADTVIGPGAVAAVRQRFARDSGLVAACGILVPLCRPGPLSAYFQFYQTYEYLRSFLWRLSWTVVRSLVLVSGAFGAYRKSALAAVGGFDPASRVEDYELIYRMHRHSGDLGLGWGIGVIPGARAVTDAPPGVGNFLHQRGRWFAGYLATMFDSADMVGNPRYGPMGRLLLPVKTFDMILPLYAVLAQFSLVALLVLGRIDDPVIISVLAGKLLFDLVLQVEVMRLYARWLNRPLDAGWLAASLLATLTEPLLFHPLRSLGAFKGWGELLRREITWQPQRGGELVSD